MVKKDKSKKKKRYLEAYNEFIKNHYNESSKVESYSRNRIDYLTITLSTGGIVFAASILKFIFENDLSIETHLIKISMIIFVLTIISNFINQHIAVEVHNTEKKWAKREQELVRYDSKEENNINFKPSLNKAIYYLNIITLLLLFGGTIILSIFLLITF